MGMNRFERFPRPPRSRRRRQFPEDDPPERVIVTVHKRQADWLRAQGLNRSAVIRWLLEQYIAELEQQEGG